LDLLKILILRNVLGIFGKNGDCKKKILFWMRLKAINRLTALIY